MYSVLSLRQLNCLSTSNFSFPVLHHCLWHICFIYFEQIYFSVENEVILEQAKIPELEKVIETGNIEKVIETVNLEKIIETGNLVKAIETGNLVKVIETGNHEKVIETGTLEKVIETGSLEKVIESGNFDNKAPKIVSTSKEFATEAEVEIHLNTSSGEDSQQLLIRSGKQTNNLIERQTNISNHNIGLTANRHKTRM